MSSNPTPTTMEAINYAKSIGFNSVPAAAIFATLYIPIFLWFAKQSFSRPTYVHFILGLFCIIRIVAYVLRATLSHSESAGENLQLLVADEVLLGVGFFGLLYSAYTLVLDLELTNQLQRPRNIILRLTSNRKLFRGAITVGVILGIVSATAPFGSTKASSLHQASVIIFLILTVLQAFQTLVFARLQYSERAKYNLTQGSVAFGKKHAISILVVISMLLLVREAFSAATINNVAKLNNEHFWYPLVAVPEIIAVLLYTIPELVPPRSEIPEPDLDLLPK